MGDAIKKILENQVIEEVVKGRHKMLLRRILPHRKIPKKDQQTQSQTRKTPSSQTENRGYHLQTTEVNNSREGGFTQNFIIN